MLHLKSWPQVCPGSKGTSFSVFDLDKNSLHFRWGNHLYGGKKPQICLLTYTQPEKKSRKSYWFSCLLKEEGLNIKLAKEHREGLKCQCSQPFRKPVANLRVVHSDQSIMTMRRRPQWKGNQLPLLKTEGRKPVEWKLIIYYCVSWRKGLFFFQNDNWSIWQGPGEKAEVYNLPDIHNC